MATKRATSDGDNADQQPAMKCRKLSLGQVVEEASHFTKKVDNVFSCLPHVLICPAIDRSVLSQPVNGATKESDELFIADNAMGLQSGGVALRRLSSIASKNYFSTSGNAPATPRPAGVDLRRLSSICVRNDNRNELLETINDSVLRDPSSANEKAVLQDVDSLTATCRKRIESLVPGVSNNASSTASRPRELKPGCIHGRR